MHLLLIASSMLSFFLFFTIATAPFLFYLLLCMIDRLQIWLNYAARLIPRIRRREHLTLHLIPEKASY
jgi:hypothetical protein